MPQTHDVGQLFVTTMRYPPIRNLPFAEKSATIREIEPPFRLGGGFAVRIPFTRKALIFGRWLDRGGPEEERLREALQSTDLDDDVEDIRAWDS